MNTGWKIYLAGYLVAFIYNIYISVKCNKEDIDNELVDNDNDEPVNNDNKFINNDNKFINNDNKFINNDDSFDGEMFWGGTHDDPVDIYESIYDISIGEVILSLLFSLLSWVAVLALLIGQNITFTNNNEDDIIFNDKDDIVNDKDNVSNDKDSDDFTNDKDDIK